MVKGDGGYGSRGREPAGGWRWQWAALAALVSLPLLAALARRSPAPQLLLLAADSMGILLGGGQAAQAQTAQVLVSTRAVEGDTYINATGTVGVKFTTGSSPVTLSHVSLIVATGNANTVVTIRDGSGEDPGARVVTLTNPATFSANNLNAFTAPANTLLKANTTYFLVLNDGVTNASHQAAFSFTSLNTYRGRNGWRIHDSIRSFNGSNWTSASPIPRFVIYGNNVAPAQPVGFKAVAGPFSGQVTLSWDNPNNSVISGWEYRIRAGGVWQDWTRVPGSVASTTSHTVSGLTNGNLYFFKVRAVAGLTKGPESPQFNATPVAVAPAKPTGLTAVAGNTFVTLSWDDPGNPTISKWYYNLNGASVLHLIPGSGAATTSFTVWDLTNDLPYSFHIRAFADKMGAPAEVRATPSAAANAPAKPTGLKAAAGPRRNQVSLQWDDPANNAISKWQYRQKTGTGSCCGIRQRPAPWCSTAPAPTPLPRPNWNDRGWSVLPWSPVLRGVCWRTWLGRGATGCCGSVAPPWPPRSCRGAALRRSSPSRRPSCWEGWRPSRPWGTCGSPPWPRACPWVNPVWSVVATT